VTGLDDSDPYSSDSICTDSPGVPLAAYTYVKNTITPTMFLMFKPTGDDSEWVPLRKVQWAWMGEATPNSSWTIADHFNPNDISTPHVMPSDTDAADYPPVECRRSLSKLEICTEAFCKRLI
jgi:hypothetical protein